MKASMKTAVSVALIISLALLQSCNDKGTPYDDNLYLVSAQRELTFTRDNVTALLNLAKTKYPEVSEVVPDVTSGVIGYSITYNTTFQGEELLVSGLVVIPSVPGSYPVLSYQNGTNTLNANAPSVNPYDGLYQLLECIAGTGYVVVIADYIGFGSSSQLAHPYLHKESTVRTLVDMLYALKEFDEDVAKDIDILNEHYLLGYSQGGWATLALHEALEKDYYDDFTVAGTTCGAGPYDISYFNTWILAQTDYPMPVFLGYIANAYAQYSLTTNTLGQLFNEPYGTLIPSLYDGLHSSEQINDQLTQSIAALFTSDYISGYASSATYESIRNAIIDNSIHGWDSNIPLLLVHGNADVYVPPVLSENLYDEMIDAGTSADKCTYTSLGELNHTDAIVPAGIAGLEFFKSLREN